MKVVLFCGGLGMADMIERFQPSTALACLLAVPPQSSHHVIDIGEAAGSGPGETPRKKRETRSVMR